MICGHKVPSSPSHWNNRNKGNEIDRPGVMRAIRITTADLARRHPARCRNPRARRPASRGRGRPCPSPAAEFLTIGFRKAVRREHVGVSLLQAKVLGMKTARIGRSCRPRTDRTATASRQRTGSPARRSGRTENQSPALPSSQRKLMPRPPLSVHSARWRKWSNSAASATISRNNITAIRRTVAEVVIDEGDA